MARKQLSYLDEKHNTPLKDANGLFFASKDVARMTLANIYMYSERHLDAMPLLQQVINNKFYTISEADFSDGENTSPFNTLFEEDELIYDFYMKYKEQSFYRLSELSNILEQRGFTKHGTTTIKMRLQNYSYLDNGIGLSHVAKQSRSIYENKTKKTSPRLRQNGSL